MSRWRAFVDVLDEILADPEPITTAQQPAAARQSTRVASTPLYAFTPHLTPNRFWTAPGPYRPTTVAESAAPPRHVETPSSVEHGFRQVMDDTTQETTQTRRDDVETRAKRPLKPVEESALQTLVRLGAALDGSFTARELRSTFRALAQRYHPDRHPHVTDAERSRLGATFAELTSAYGVLTDATH